MIQSFTKFGYSVCSVKSSGGTSGAPTAFTTSYQAFPITVDSTNSTNSASFPDDCNIQSIEFEFTARDSATAVTMYLARDSAGDIAITNPSSENITNGATTSSKGGVSFSNEIDYHFDGSVGNTSRGTLYVIALATGSSGSAAGNIRVNWRS
jgi:hypothetical protein